MSENKASQENRPKRILVVDDEPDICSALHMCLEHAGYHVTTAGNGRAALEQVAAARPDLILLDVMMPEVDGFEVLKRLRADAATADIIIVLLTARTEYDDMAKSWEQGADLHLSKPFNFVEVTDFVKCILDGENC